MTYLFITHAPHKSHYTRCWELFYVFASRQYTMSYWPFHARSVSRSRSIKLNKRTTVTWGLPEVEYSSSEDDQLYFTRGRSRSRSRSYRSSISRSTSRQYKDLYSYDSLRSLGASYHSPYIGHDHPTSFYICEPETHILPPGWTCSHCTGHSPSPHPSNSICERAKEKEKEKVKTSETENKAKTEEKEKEAKRLKELEEKIKKLDDDNRYLRESYGVRRSLEDIDLELAGCNRDIETMKTIRYRSSARSRSDSCTRNCSCGR